MASKLTFIRQAKRKSIGSPILLNGSFPVPATFQAPDYQTSPTCLTTTLAGPASTPLALESADFSFHLTDPEQPLVDRQPGTATEPDIAFASAGPDLEFGDFNWFTQTEDCLPTPPSASSASLELPSEAAHATAQLSHHHLPPSSQEGAPTDASSLAAACFNPSRLPCLCDPTALGIISELQFLQTSRSPLDTALLLARRGFSTVSSCLSCATCLSSSRSLFYACVLIIQQVFTCYGTVRSQGTKMLGFNSPPKEAPLLQRSTVSIGEFEVEGEESCNGVLDAIIKAEMERGKGVLGGLERWAETGTGIDGTCRLAGLLLQTLKEEIGC
jgi:hypothetical protein